MNQPRVYICPLVPNPFPTSLPIPSLWVVPVHRLRVAWSSISHMVIYMFQCYSLKSSHPCLLPQSPKACSLYLCLFCCLTYRIIVPFSSVQSLSHVRLFATPWTAAHQASLSITNSQSPPKPMSIKLVIPSNNLILLSVMPTNHLISSHPLLLLLSIFPSTMEYYSAIKKNAFESVLMRWMKLEPIIQREVSQKEKHQYSILTHIYGI